MAASELNITYTLTGPTGARAVFNNQSDPDYVGMLTEVSGLDSPDIRESAEDLVQQDGGIHGAFYYGRRPITLTGIVLNPSSAAARNVRLEKLAQASDALRGDAVLSWTPSGGVPTQVSVRRQQPLRVSGGWQKNFQLGLVAADARVYSQTLHVETIAITSDNTVFSRNVTNAGNTATNFIVDVTGPGFRPYVVRHGQVPAEQILLTNYTIPAGQVLTLDSAKHSAKVGGVSVYQYVDFAFTNWFSLPPGTHSMGFAFFSGISAATTKYTISWRDAWV